MGLRASGEEAGQWLERQLADLDCEAAPREAEVDILFSFRMGGVSANRRDFHLLYQGSRLAARGHDLTTIATTLRQELNLLVGLSSPGHFVLRAGVLQLAQRSILVLSPPQGGISTLIEDLRKRGLTCKDEGHVLLRRRQARLHSLWRNEPECPELGAAFWLPYRRAGRFRPKLQPPGASALRLFAQAPGAALQASMILAESAWLASRIPCWDSARPEAGRAAPQLINFLERQLD